MNLVTAAALWRLSSRSKRPLYDFLLSVTAADILAQLCIVLVDFLLETAVFHRAVPPLLLRAVSAAEFGANHASIWATVPLTVDRYVALCHPLLHRRLRSPSRTRRVITAVLTLAIASGAPFFFWSDLWRTTTPPSVLDAALIWSHVTIIYFLPCVVFLTLNSRIVWILRRRTDDRVDFRANDRANLRASAHRSTALLLAVSAAFALLWAPRVAALLCHLYVSTVNRDWRVHLVYDLANMAAMLNTALNFFLYCFVSRPFRRTASDIIRDVTRGRGHKNRDSRDRSMSSQD